MYEDYRFMCVGTGEVFTSRLACLLSEINDWFHYGCPVTGWERLW